MKLVLATRNRDKAREIVDLFAGLDVQLLTLDAFAPAPETIEDGDTLEANALKKAREASAHTGLSALADDTGLEVDALDGAPGIYAARYAGPRATYAQNCTKLLAALAGVGEDARTARFRTVIALALNTAALSAAGGTAKGTAALSKGILHGRIAHTARGTYGFGYDPVFLIPDTNRTLAELSPDEKNRSSHRYRAALEMRELLVRHGLARGEGSEERAWTP